MYVSQFALIKRISEAVVPIVFLGVCVLPL